jgi:hypothetical protein
MSRWEISGERDLGMSQWHREQFDHDAAAFDVDLIGMCHLCSHPLYAWECTRTSGYKQTRWLQQVCQFLNIPGYLIHYQNDTDGRVQTLTASILIPYTTQRIIGQAPDFAVHIKDLRASHCRLWHDR